MGLLAVVELPLRSGLAKDKVVNTYAFAGTGTPTTEQLGVVKTAIPRVYNVAVPSQAITLGSLLSAAIDRSANACVVKLYDITGHLDGSPHGSPIDLQTFTMPAAASTAPMPEEVALCATLEAAGRSTQRVEVADGTDAGSAPDRPRQRYTGRIYFGPFVQGIAEQDSAGMARPTPASAMVIRDAVIRLAQEVDTNSADTLGLAVWSRKDHALRGIDNVRTDDAFDTQRRRGKSPTAITRVAITGLGVPELELGA